MIVVLILGEEAWMKARLGSVGFPSKLWYLFLNCRPGNVASWASLVVIGWATTVRSIMLVEFLLRFMVLGFFAFLLNGFSFSINNVFDVKEDVNSGKTSNMVAMGKVSRKEAAAFSIIIGAISVAFFSATGGLPGLLLSASCLILGLLYSTPPVRFKEKPALDILSHGFFLGSLLVVLGAHAYGGVTNATTYTYAIAFFFISCLFQLQNMLGDYFVDRDSGVKTTAVRLGTLERGRWLASTFATLGVAATIYTSWYFIVEPILVGLLILVQLVNLVILSPKVSVYMVYVYQKKIQPYFMVGWGVTLLLLTIIL